MRINPKIKETISLVLEFFLNFQVVINFPSSPNWLVVFQLSFLNLNYLSYRKCLRACGLFTPGFKMSTILVITVRKLGKQVHTFSDVWKCLEEEDWRKGDIMILCTNLWPGKYLTHNNNEVTTFSLVEWLFVQLFSMWLDKCTVLKNEWWEKNGRIITSKIDCAELLVVSK